MGKLMDRPYRNPAVKKANEEKRVEHLKKLAERREARVKSKEQPVPPVLTSMVEESLAGIQPSDTDAAPEGPSPEE